MSNMNHLAFDQNCNIQELSFNEIDEVDGAGFPVVAAIGLFVLASAAAPVIGEAATGFADGLVEGFTDDE